MQQNPVRDIALAEEKAAATIEAAREKRAALLKAAEKAASEQSARRIKEAEQKAAAIMQAVPGPGEAFHEEDPALAQIRGQARERQPACIESILRAIPSLI